MGEVVVCAAQNAEEGVVVELVFRWGQIGREDVSCPAMDNQARGDGSCRLRFVVHRQVCMVVGLPPKVYIPLYIISMSLLI